MTHAILVNFFSAGYQLAVPVKSLGTDGINQ